MIPDKEWQRMVDRYLGSVLPNKTTEASRPTAEAGAALAVVDRPLTSRVATASTSSTLVATGPRNTAVVRVQPTVDVFNPRRELPLLRMRDALW